jgi:hypothetical protein
VVGWPSLRGVDEATGAEISYRVIEVRVCARAASGEGWRRRRRRRRIAY